LSKCYQGVEEKKTVSHPQLGFTVLPFSDFTHALTVKKYNNSEYVYCESLSCMAGMLDDRSFS